MKSRDSHPPQRQPSHAHLRVGVHVFPSDPYWVQVRAAVLRNLTSLGMTVVPIEILENDPALASYKVANLEQEMRFGDEEIRAKNIDVLISNDVTDAVAYHLLESGLPIIYLVETPLRHPRLISITGLYEAGRLAGEFTAQALGGQGQVLCLGGLLDRGGDRGISRINGFYDALRAFPAISVVHAPSYWKYEDAYAAIETRLRQRLEQGEDLPNAIFALSDSMALAARDALHSFGGRPEEVILVGVNGDPLALAAIANGSMTATIETSPDDVGRQAAEFALHMAQGKTLSQEFKMHPNLVTRANVFERGMNKLYEIAELPNLLVGVNRQREQERLLQLETSIAINRRVGTLLDPLQLSQEIAELIAANYGYEKVFLYLVSNRDQQLIPYGCQAGGSVRREAAIPIEQAGLIRDAVQRNEPVYISDWQPSAPAEDAAAMRSRLVLPIHLGDSILGVLDLHSSTVRLLLRQDLAGLQALADQLGITMRNAELYTEALQARQKAETADRLKTRLLANVSHELRAPLNIMMGYSQLALNEPNPYQVTLPSVMRRDLGYILSQGEHLQHMINDLLDLSRAEIGALELALEVVEPNQLLTQAFESFTKSLAATEAVHWRLQLPERLPLIHADPARLRQIFLNLLSNAAKFTLAGQIGLGAEVEPPYLHVWVQDTGLGIPPHLQDQIFEPFVSVDHAARREKGIGLGLAITRRLVALHGGLLSLDSQAGVGSTFHVYLPLPDLSGNALAATAERNPNPADESEGNTLLYISAVPAIPGDVQTFAAAQHVSIQRLTIGDDVEAILRLGQPIAIAWDIAAANQQQTTSREWSLIQRLRSHPRGARLPFLVYATPQTGSPAPDHSLTGALLKPIQARSLAEMLAGIGPAAGEQPIWVIDDDPEALRLVAQICREVFPGGEILTAEDGGRALENLAQVQRAKQAPRLVLLDLMMPGVDGFEVLAALRQHPLTQRTPVLILSGKMLTFEDVQRLDFPLVSYQPKQLFTADAAMATLAQAQAPLSQPKGTLARHALAYLMQNYTQNLTRGEVASAVGVTESYLTLIFRQEVGVTPWEFLLRLRVAQACELLKSTAASITEIAGQVGFNDSAYFSRVFRKQMGLSPQQFRALPG